MKKMMCMLLVGATLWACSDNEAYDELPAPIVTFITKYWPNPVIDSYVQPSADEYEVVIKNGPSLTFDGNYSWTEVDGNGLPLPQIFLYDQLPGTLYDYLEAGSYLGSVFKVERDSQTYSVELLNFDIKYDVATGAVSGNS